MQTNFTTKLFTMIVVMTTFSTIALAQHYYLAFPLSSPSQALDHEYGVGISMGESYLGVGSFRENVSFGHDGRVYLYNADTGAYLRTIHTPNSSLNGAFGWSIAFDGDLMLVGSYADFNMNNSSGAGYLFNSDTGELLADFVSEIGQAGDGSGWSVALQGPLALVGAPGYDEGAADAGGVHAYFTTFLSQITTILPDTPIAGERFGWSVAIDGDYIVVGAPYIADSPLQTGSVYVFDVLTGLQLHRIVPAGSAVGDFVGGSVDISEGVIAIGAPYNDTMANNAGAVYLYDAQTGSLIDTYHASNPSSSDRFGVSVSIEAGTLVVGAPGRDQIGRVNVGSVFVFSVDGSYEVTPPFISTQQEFGRRTVINDGRIAGAGVGVLDIDGYAATLGRFCNADVNADGVRDFFDVSAFIKFQLDYNGDGIFNFFDVSAFLADYNSDCI
jgi:hypothetical protein